MSSSCFLTRNEIYRRHYETAEINFCEQYFWTFCAAKPAPAVNRLARSDCDLPFRPCAESKRHRAGVRVSSNHQLYNTLQPMGFFASMLWRSRENGKNLWGVFILTWINVETSMFKVFRMTSESFQNSWLSSSKISPNIWLLSTVVRLRHAAETCFPTVICVVSAIWLFS